MTDPEKVRVGDCDYQIPAEQPGYLRIGDRVLASSSNLGETPVVGVIRDFRHHSYGNYARIEVESPPEYVGRIAHIYSGKVLERSMQERTEGR